MKGSTVLLFSMFCGVMVLFSPVTFSPILAAPISSAGGRSSQPAAINRMGDAFETAEEDEEDDDELEVSGGDRGCDHGDDAELLYPNSEDADEDDDKDYSSDDRYT